MKYKIGDRVIFLGDIVVEGKKTLEYQEVYFRPTCLTIGKEYEIVGITGYTIWLVCDSNTTQGYRLIEHDGYYKFGGIHSPEVRKFKLNRLNEI